MKKILFSFIFLLVSVNVYAGDYDGVWEFSGFSRLSDDYTMIRQNGNQLLVVGLCSDLDCWDASLGPINGNQAEVDLFIEIDDWTGHYSIRFTSKTTAVVTITAFNCNGCGDDERPPLNTPFKMRKIF